MLTTFANRSLTSFAVKYQFFNDKLKIIIITDAAHKLYGDVNITLANCESKNVYSDAATLIEDVFNNTFLFSATSTTRLEHTFACSNGFNPSVSEITVSDDGSAITAVVDNLLLEIEKGNYCFKLLETADSVFSTALVNFQEQEIITINSVSYDGKIDTYAETADSAYEAIDNQELSFDFKTEISITDDTATTNIPMLIIKR